MTKEKDVKLVAPAYVEEEENPIWESMRKELHPDQLTQIQEDQKHSHCELDHGGDPRGPGPYPADNTMMVKSNNGLMAVHTCWVCAESLNDQNSEWYLFICFTCMSTKWIHESDMKQEYNEQIIGMSECPNCVGKFTTN